VPVQRWLMRRGQKPRVIAPLGPNERRGVPGSGRREWESERPGVMPVSNGLYADSACGRTHDIPEG
jgi:hypothetical protein